MDKKLKVLWVSDLGAPTGFARVSHSIIENVRNRLDITGFGINYSGNPHKLGIDVYPATAGPQDIMGFTKIGQTVKHGDFDIIYILQDAWVISKYLKAIKDEVEADKIPKIVVYFPVDAEDHDSQWYDDFDIVSQLVAYTKFGNGVVSKVVPDLNIKIIPHGIDSDKFRMAYPSREDAKKILFANNEKKSKGFMALNMNRNQPRKRLDITIRGFKIFAEGKDDVSLYMHCGVVDASIDVTRLCVKLGIDDKLVLTNLVPGPQNVSDEDLNLFMNAADVGINTSMGEGWGLCSMEHAVTGAPQIVPDSSACTELFSDVGILVPTVADYTFDHIMTVGKLVSPEGVAKALEVAYKAYRDGKDLGKAAKEKFLSEKYDWKVISEQWYSIFTEVTK